MQTCQQIEMPKNIYSDVFITTCMLVAIQPVTVLTVQKLTLAIIAGVIFGV